MKKIKYTYLTTIALFIILFNLSAICQDSYQSSTFNGFGIRISALGDFWKGEIITDKSTFGGGIDVTAMYGIGEVIGIYAGYQNIFGIVRAQRNWIFDLYRQSKTSKSHCRIDGTLGVNLKQTKIYCISRNNGSTINYRNIAGSI